MLVFRDNEHVGTVTAPMLRWRCGEFLPTAALHLGEMWLRVYDVFGIATAPEEVMLRLSWLFHALNADDADDDADADADDAAE